MLDRTLPLALRLVPEEAGSANPALVRGAGGRRFRSETAGRNNLVRHGPGRAANRYPAAIDPKKPPTRKAQSAFWN